jgi:RimJ/RimL family protein N-acetyltransferase
MLALPTTVRSARLTIRCWTEDDAENLHRAISASIEHLLPWMPWAAFEPRPVDDRRGLIRMWQRERDEGGDIVYGVFHGDVAIGGTGFHRRIGPDGLEVGYWIHADYVGRGYATEVTEALTGVAFANDEIERVEIRHDKANVASGRVPLHLGYTFVEETPDAITAPGEIGVNCTWRMTREAWFSRTS